MPFLINLHSHTFFSDGKCSPLGMALKANELGHSALVITDHYHQLRSAEWHEWKWKLHRQACYEAKYIIPVIVGIELWFRGEEVLVFGGEMIKRIMQHNFLGEEVKLHTLLDWKEQCQSAFILCHPVHEDTWTPLIPLLDGYELFNSGSYMFPDMSDESLSHLPSWCNSDAHFAGGLVRGHNIVDKKITNESELILYIKKGKQPKHSLKVADEHRRN